MKLISEDIIQLVTITVIVTRSGERKDAIEFNGDNIHKCKRWDRDFQQRLSQRSMKILVIEDDTEIAQALAEALTSQHYIVDIAADGLHIAERRKIGNRTAKVLP